VSLTINNAIRFKLAALLLVLIALACQSSRGSDGSIMDPILGHQQTFPLSDHIGSFDQNRSYELSSLIEIGLANNPQTRSAWFNALAKSAQVGQAKAPYYPKLSLNAQGGYQKSFYQINNGPMGLRQTSLTPELDFEYLLLDFGRRAADVRRTVALLEAANLAFSRNVQSTVYAIQQSYFAHTAALSQSDAAKANLELSKTILAMVEAQLANGLGTKPELDIARKTFAQADFDLSSADRNVEVTLGNLRVAAGLPANAPLKVVTGEAGGNHTNAEASPYEALGSKVDAMIDQAILKRPDLAARRADIAASRAAVERAKADFMPKLSLRGAYSSEPYVYTASQPSQTGTYYGNAQGYSGFAVLSWDLFDGFQRVEKVKQSQAEESQARANAESTKLQTTQDVWIAYNDFLRSRKKVTYADSQVSSAEENFKSAKAAFDNQLLNITDLISNQSALAASRFDQAGARADYLTSLAALSLAMGQFSTPNGTKVKPALL
jgi:outer membrane protein TolC